MSKKRAESIDYELVASQRSSLGKKRCVNVVTSPVLTLILAILCLASFTYFIFGIIHTRKSTDSSTDSDLHSNNTDQTMDSDTTSITNAASKEKMINDQPTFINCQYDNNYFTKNLTIYKWKNQYESAKCVNKFNFMNSLPLFFSKNRVIHLNSTLFCTPETNHSECNYSKDILVFNSLKIERNDTNKSYILEKCDFIGIIGNDNYQINESKQYNISFGRKDFDFQLPNMYDLIKVKCVIKVESKENTLNSHESKEVVYEDMIFQVIKKQGIRAIANSEISFHYNHTNVIFLVLGSFSKGSFHSNLQRTRSFFEQRNVNFLPGFNSLGSTFEQNVWPLLTGIKKTDLSNLETLNEYGGYLDLPILRKLKENGHHVTLLAEDQTNQIKTQPENKTSPTLKSLPVDHYMRPFLLPINYNDKIDNPSTSDDCAQGYTHVLEYTKAFHKEYQYIPKFSIVLINDFKKSEDLDEQLFLFFESLERNADFNNTAIIMTGGQGASYQNNEEFDEKSLLENSPFSLVYLPKKFHRTHPVWIENIQDNSKRLTTSLDLYQSLMQLLNFTDFTKNEQKEGMSLFDSWSEERSCSSTGVPLTHCTCASYSKPSWDQRDLIEKASNFIVQNINELITDLDQLENCHRLHLNSSLAATWVVPIDMDMLDKVESGTKALLLRVVTSPGEMVYEAVVEVNDKQEFKLLQKVVLVTQPLLLPCQQKVDRAIEQICYC